MKSKTALAQTYYRLPWQKHIAAKKRSVKSINLLIFVPNIVSFTSNAFSPARHKSLSKMQQALVWSTFGHRT